LKIPESGLQKLGVSRDDVFYLDTIAVEKEFAGRQYGSRLLEQVENEARSKGFKYLFLRTDFDGNDSSHPNHYVCEFYRNKKRSYKELGLLNGGKEGKTHFVKLLTPEKVDGNRVSATLDRVRAKIGGVLKTLLSTDS
jgi:ribosomal protein S18 acetylase RimI-like enzyme